MKNFEIVSITDKGTDVSLVTAKNKFEAVRKARGLCKHEQWIPIYVSKVSKRYAQLLAEICNKC